VLTARCDRCGEENAAGARFCSNCGARLAAVTGGGEERKLVSILFVDLVDFTAQSDRADPEDVRDALRRYHAEARRHVEQHGGTLEKFIGDAVMAVFGAPRAHGDDAERAVRAGLAVLEAVGGLGLTARAAVNTGEAVVAVNARETGDALAMGDVVNTASRLQSAAPSGRLVVGAETHRATRNVIAYEELAPVDAKGKADPVEAWLALAASAAPAERPIARNPLVGRSRELDLIRSHWERAVGERRPHLVTLLGPPGIGKSRLCQEVSALVNADDGRILRGRCLPYGEQTGYQAFAHLVRGAAGILESDGPETGREKLGTLVDEVVPVEETEQTARHLAIVLGLGGDDTVTDARPLLYSARRLLENIAEAGPALVVFEDIHWAQPSELALLEYLARQIRESPVMLIALARPELLDSHPGWGSGLLSQTTIPLEPLQSADAATLAAHAFGNTASSLQLDRVVEVAEGNPLFLEELAASVVEAGADAELPVTVREAIASRIDAMPEDARGALLSAAVVGRTFWRNALVAAGGAEDVDEALYVLEARDLVRRRPTSQIAGDTEYSFKHMLIREVAYATLPRAVRRERHAAVARYIEEELSESTGTLATILAHHWREAGEPARAIPYLLAAAEAAMRSWARETVVDLYATALELAVDDAQRHDLRLRRGLALVELAEWEDAAEALGQLLPELEGRQRLDALIGLGHAHLWSEREAETLETAAEALALAEALGDASGIAAAVALESQGLGMRGQGDDLGRALELGDRALELWVPGTRLFSLAQHLHLHADVTYWAGQYERSLSLSRETRDVAADVHSAFALLRGGGVEGIALAGLGRHEEAIAIWDGLFAFAREFDVNARGVLNYSSLAYRELRDLGEARRRSEEARELSAGQSFGMPLQFAGSDLLFTTLLEGDVGTAQVEWPKLWKEAEHATAWTTWLIYGRLAVARAEIALHAESPESAVEWARKAIEVAHRTRRRKYEARSLSLLGEALARLGRREDAIEALEAAVRIADELVGPPARWDARAALGRAAYALGDDDRAAVAYREAAELVESFAATLGPERSERLLAAPEISELLAISGSS
jgi:class 3 adenylate cyclase/tetratricopeptide (TPR) repeat protein